jgi:hypothetical protein
LKAFSYALQNLFIKKESASKRTSRHFSSDVVFGGAKTSSSDNDFRPSLRISNRFFQSRIIVTNDGL